MSDTELEPLVGSRALHCGHQIGENAMINQFYFVEPDRVVARDNDTGKVETFLVSWAIVCDECWRNAKGVLAKVDFAGIAFYGADDDSLPESRNMTLLSYLEGGDA